MVSSIGTPEWGARLEGVSVGKQTMNRLVMDYLVIEGHKDAAERFMRESGTPCDVDLETIVERVAVRAAIEAGDVQAAIDGVNKLEPRILQHDTALCFHLRQQQLIELIRSGDIGRALAFAQEEVAPLVEANGRFVEELEQTMMLLAYEQTADSPASQLMSSEQRRKTASELNAAILHSQQQQQEPKLPMMLRMMRWAQGELQERHQVTFPVIEDVAAAAPQLPPARNLQVVHRTR